VPKPETHNDTSISTGVPPLDALIEELRIGDNVVFLLERDQDYYPFAAALAGHAARMNEPLVYLQSSGAFTSVARLSPTTSTLYLDTSQNVASLTRGLHRQLENTAGPRYYLCDPWSDQTLAPQSVETFSSVFLATCPLLYRLNTIAYWGIRRDQLSRETIAAIKDCTQVCLALDGDDHSLRITPIKVWGRYSEQMFHSHRVAVAASGQIDIEPLPLAPLDQAAYAEILDDKNRELALVRDVLSQRNEELALGNAQLAEQSRLYHALQTHIGSLQTLLGASRTISGSLMIAQVHRAILKAAQDLFAATAVSLQVTPPGSVEASCVSLGRMPSVDWSLPEPHQPVQAQSLPSNGPASAARAVISVQGRSIGWLQVSAPSPVLLQTDGTTLLRYLAAQASVALDNAYLHQTLRRQEQQLELLVEDLIISEERESKRLALDLHDGLVQEIVASYQHLQSAQVWQSKREDVAERETALGIQLLRDAIQEARQLIGQLRPAGLDDFGLVQAIRLYATRLRAQANWQISVVVSPAWSERIPAKGLAKSTSSSLFRIVQEASTNALKYASSPRLQITMDANDEALSVGIRDWGSGFDPETVPETSNQGQRIGLVGIRERARLLGGSCLIQSASGSGTHITVTIPLERALASEPVAPDDESRSSQ